MELIVALFIIAGGIALAAAVMLNAPPMAELHAAAEKWLRDTERQHGDGVHVRSGKPPASVPMPREYLTPLREHLDGLYWELQQAQEALAKAQAQPAAPPSGPAPTQPAAAQEMR